MVLVMRPNPTSPDLRVALGWMLIGVGYSTAAGLCLFLKPAIFGARSSPPLWEHLEDHYRVMWTMIAIVAASLIAVRLGYSLLRRAKSKPI